ncbi:hypothetical protein AB0N60_13535 [Streptomyces microflavus]|uniref:hypothetical protein n=1 Tax=Streptomyces microflavus TaxID=1919 RepID=UPI0034373025
MTRISFTARRVALPGGLASSAEGVTVNGMSSYWGMTVDTRSEAAVDLSGFDEHLPALHAPPIDKLEAHMWGLLDGPSGPGVTVGAAQLEAAIIGLRIVAAGDGTCYEPCLQLANTLKRLLPGGMAIESPFRNDLVDG